MTSLSFFLNRNVFTITVSQQQSFINKSTGKIASNHTLNYTILWATRYFRNFTFNRQISEIICVINHCSVGRQIDNVTNR